MANVNFKLVEVKAFNRTEALNSVMESDGLQIIKDATQAWKNAGKPITTKALNDFCAEYLQKNTKMASGIGCSITIEAGSNDTRMKPFTIINTKNEKGPRKYKVCYQGINKATGKIEFECSGTKAKAQEMAKNLYMKEGFKGDIIVKYTKNVVDGEDEAFEVHYTPSKNTKLGSYLCFGVL